MTFYFNTFKNNLPPIERFKMIHTDTNADYSFKRISQLQAHDLFTFELIGLDTAYYNFLGLENGIYKAKIFQTEDIVEWREDKEVIVVGKAAVEANRKTKTDLHYT